MQQPPISPLPQDTGQGTAVSLQLPSILLLHQLTVQATLNRPRLPSSLLLQEAGERVEGSMQQPSTSPVPQEADKGSATPSSWLLPQQAGEDTEEGLEQLSEADLQPLAIADPGNSLERQVRSGLPWQADGSTDNNLERQSEAEACEVAACSLLLAVRVVCECLHP